ncbi:DUF4142 domain-containing protein [Hymenobacter gummosus]|uniref:DUF4142 domain-containing protein n=1 Tax=Hymenobacter gummosus TaxID=1776032 RepID=A0A3S0HP70_9BACT|nr:DUF4142 domain-containing protein [Hymenobacter gummosus]RTQ50680.1 DUF4142 domain-containing protein [Hymenobacter gummosus]
MKATSLYLFVAGCALLGACSSSSTPAGTTGASTSGSTITDASPSNAASSGTNASSPTISGGSGGSIVGSGTNTGTDVNTGSAGGSGSMSGSSLAAASDINAFAGTFATMDDPTFMLTAASSNMLEIQMGQLAAQKSTNADVKSFGQMMVQHHGRASQDWQAVATPLSISMPTTLMPVHQAMMDKVMNKSGKDFDEAYMDAMETAHKLDVAMFEVKSRGAQTPAVQSFATKSLPMLRSHGKMADELEKKVD